MRWIAAVIAMTTRTGGRAARIDVIGNDKSARRPWMAT